MSRYALITDLEALGLPAGAISGIDPTALQAALDAASGLADGYLRARFTLPIVTVDGALTRAVCAIGAFDILTTRGFNPEAGSDSAIKMRYDDALKWLRGVGDGTITPALVDSSTGPDIPRAPLVISKCPRGW